jgi:aspartyl-tRNA(Asn)/glutamyl-tRNA(Gln) amidotransferase subunit C
LRPLQRGAALFMLSHEEVLRIARLARIEVDERDAERLRAELNGILALIDQMRAVDTTGVEPMSHPQALAQRLREDRVAEADQRERFQSVAPQVEDGLYLVPRVIE